MSEEAARGCFACHTTEAAVGSRQQLERAAPGVSCEACHGPQAKHANDPGALKPPLPDVANLCRRCHERDAAKPAKFPQVVTAEHSGGAVCTACHVPHNPHL